MGKLFAKVPFVVLKLQLGLHLKWNGITKLQAFRVLEHERKNVSFIVLDFPAPSLFLFPCPIPICIPKDFLKWMYKLLENFSFYLWAWKPIIDWLDSWEEENLYKACKVQLLLAQTSKDPHCNVRKWPFHELKRWDNNDDGSIFSQYWACLHNNNPYQMAIACINSTYYGVKGVNVLHYKSSQMIRTSCILNY